MEKRVTYHDQTDLSNTIKLRTVLKTLPDFTRDFFRGISTTTSTNTRCKYAYDLRIFFQFLIQANPEFREPVQGRMITNGEKGIKRKLSSLRTFYAYYYRHEMIKSNPTLQVDMPKLHKKDIIRLDADEVARMLDLIETGTDAQMSDHQKSYCEKYRTRDLAIVTLLLGTGIRVSECVGLDIEDVDFHNNGVRVVRKGGNEMMVYFGEEPVAGHEHALFFSSQRKRIGVKTVENLVKKYARQITSTKKITPHKLRSTYGTALYQETGDIYLVADVLGHKDVNTTKTHYAAMSDSRRRKAAKAVHLRED